MGLALLHSADVLLFRLGNRGDLRGQHVFKLPLRHVPLALHAERGDAMAGQLGQQRPGHALHAKGEAGVLNRAFVADLRQHIHEGVGLFFGESLPHGVDGGGGITQLGGTGHRFFRLWGVGKQGNLHAAALLYYIHS